MTGVIRWRYTDESPDKFGWPNYGRILKEKKQDNNASFEGISEEEFNKKHMKALAQADPHNFKKKKKKVLDKTDKE
jgi:hypothetical protein